MELNFAGRLIRKSESHVTMVDWIFFDVGNVLFNDDPQAYYSYRFFHEKFREYDPGLTFEALLAEREHRAVHGEDWILHSIARRFFSEEQFREHLDGLKAELLPNYDAFHLPQLGLQEVLRSLRGHYKLGIIANQPPECRNSLARRGLLDAFDVVAISEELDLYKPGTGIYEWALEQAGCDAGRAVMVGDRRDNDVGPAQALAMRTVWISWPGPHVKNWRPDDPQAQTFLESVSRVPLFAAVDHHPRPDVTVESLHTVPQVIESLHG